MKNPRRPWLAAAIGVLLALPVAAQDGEAKSSDEPPPGESGSVVQVANLVYARVRSSVCFSDHFLRQAAQTSRISTSRRFHPAKADSKELYKFPFVIMTGEGSFVLPEEERKNLKSYLEGGGFLLASAGCSSREWDTAFRSEIAKILKGKPLKALPMDHPLFHTVKDIGSIEVKRGKANPLEGIEIDGRLAVVYSTDGLNDTAHVKGCCCCGGNEILNSVDINLNILMYALTH